MNEVMSVLCVIFILAIQGFESAEPKLSVSGCICPGNNLVFECSIEGGGTTVWKGSFIRDCSGSTEIPFRHINDPNEFTQLSQICNNGAITATALSANKTTYTSQLSINTSVISLSNGNTVTCAHDDGNNGEMIIDTWMMIDPPMNLHLEKANATHLKFSWDPVFPSCPPFKYNVLTSNCGSCYDNVDSATTVCEKSQILTNIHLCSIAVQPKCNETVGNVSDILQVIIKVPEAPLLMVTPSYLYAHNNINRDVLQRLNVTVKEIVPLSVPNSPGSENYTIIYSDANKNINCGLEIIPATSCMHGVCNLTFEVYNSSSMCSPDADIKVTAFATNMFGESPHAVAFADGVNKFIKIKFKFIEGRLTCKFLNDSINGPKLCVVNFMYYGSNGDNHLETYQNKNVGNLVTVSFQNLTRNAESSYSFAILANNGTKTVLVEGMLNGTTIFGSTDGQDKEFEFIQAVIIIAAVIITLILVVVVVILICVLCSRRARSQGESRTYGCCFCCRKKPTTLKCIQFFVKDKPGSLKKAVGVFKDNDINISSVETCPSKPGDEYKGFHIFYDCSIVFDVEVLINQLKSRDVGAISVRELSDDDQKLQMLLQFSVRNTQGTLLRVLTVLEKHDISVENLGTLNKHNLPPAIQQFSIECHLSCYTREKLRHELKDCGAMNVIFEIKVPLPPMDKDTECIITVKSDIDDHAGSFHEVLENLSRILKDNDREFLFVDMGPGDVQQQQYINLLCTHPRKNKKYLQKQIKQALGNPIISGSKLAESRAVREITMPVGGISTKKIR